MSTSTKTKVVFETSTLASAIAKAARVAPNKGAAYDKAAGIVIEIDPDAAHPVTIKSTNLEVTYLEWVNFLEMEGPKVTWRVPSQIINGILMNLPIGTDSTVTLMHDDVDLLVRCGKKRSKIRRMADDLPYLQWEAFDPSGMLEVPGFSKRVAQVSWACDGDSIPLTGVHITGERLVATNRFRLADVPCTVPVSKPITVPLDVLAPILKNVVDAKLEAHDRRIHLMPDESTQITATIFDAEYPPVDRIRNVEVPDVLTVNREAFRESLASTLVLVKSERYPMVTLTVGEGKIGIGMYVEGVGQMDDEIEVDGAAHPPVDLHFTPTYITEALGHSDAAAVEFSYNKDNPLSIVKFFDAKDDYSAWIIPRKKISGGDA